MADSPELKEKLESFQNNINVQITIKHRKHHLEPIHPQPSTSKKIPPSRKNSPSPPSRHTTKLASRVKTLSKNIELSKIDSKAIKKIFSKRLPMKKFLTPTQANFKIDLKSKTPLQSASRINKSFILGQKSKNSFQMIGEKILNLHKNSEIHLKNLHFNLNLNKFAGL